MKIRFIINPIAGTGKQKGIEQIIKKNIKDYEIFYTHKKGDAETISKSAIEKGIKTIIAVGGDGTVNECVKAIVSSNNMSASTELGVIPCGSGNGFAYHIGMKKNIEQAIKQLKNTRSEWVDTCSINGIPFINVAGIGFDAHIAKLFSTRKKRGFINYLMLILKELNYKCQNYHITYDPVDEYPMLFKPNKNIVDGTITSYMIAFANSSQYGNNVKICPTADIKDGILNLSLIHISEPTRPY